MTNLVTFPDLARQNQHGITLESYQGLPDTFDPSALRMNTRALRRVQTTFKLGALSINLHDGTGTSQQVMSEHHIEYPDGVLFGASQTVIHINGAAVTRFIRDDHKDPLNPRHQACVIDQAIRDELVKINRSAWFNPDRFVFTALTSGPVALQAVLMQSIDMPGHVISYALLRSLTSVIAMGLHKDKHQSSLRDTIHAYRKSLFMGLALDRYVLGAGIIGAHTFVRPTHDTEPRGRHAA